MPNITQIGSDLLELSDNLTRIRFFASQYG